MNEPMKLTSVRRPLGVPKGTSVQRAGCARCRRFSLKVPGRRSRGAHRVISLTVQLRGVAHVRVNRSFTGADQSRHTRTMEVRHVSDGRGRRA